MLTIVKKNSKITTYKGVLEEKVVKIMSSGEISHSVVSIREDYVIRRALSSHTSSDDFLCPSTIPQICFAAEWKKMQRKLVMKQFNGLVLLQVNNLRSTEDAVELRKLASQQPYTRMAFVGLTGYSVMIVCRIVVLHQFRCRKQVEKICITT